MLLLKPRVGKASPHEASAKEGTHGSRDAEVVLPSSSCPRMSLDASPKTVISTRVASAPQLALLLLPYIFRVILVVVACLSLRQASLANLAVQLLYSSQQQQERRGAGCCERCQMEREPVSVEAWEQKSERGRREAQVTVVFARETRESAAAAPAPSPPSPSLSLSPSAAALSLRSCSRARVSVAAARVVLLLCVDVSLQEQPSRAAVISLLATRVPLVTLPLALSLSHSSS